MPPDSEPQPRNDNLPPGSTPPLGPSSPPPLIEGAPSLGAGSPAPPVPEPAGKGGAARRSLIILLSLCLGLFLADAIVSLADDSLILLFGVHLLGVVRLLVFAVAMLTTVVVYALMGVTPMVPKRLFLPITLFNPVAALALIPVMIYGFHQLERVAWAISLAQVVIGLGILYCVQGGLRFRWPLVGEGSLRSRRFSWLNLAGFVLANVLVLLPAVVAYLAVCASLAVGHFSQGFLALRPGGFMVQVRKYVRADGKTIQLVPMAHVGDAEFYRKLSGSFPTNAVVLMEGVTDENNLLTNSITYKRMATSLGLAEQQKEFHPVRVEIVRADVDTGEFTTNTVGFLNMAMRVHSKGLSAETILEALRFSPPPHFDEELIDDLLRKRNRHLLEEIRAQLSQPEPIVVPWGAAHMPGIAEAIQAEGFRLAETRDIMVIRFGAAGTAARRGRNQAAER